MPASIVLTALSFRTPDNQPLFEDLDLSFWPQRTGLIGRNGVGKSTLLKVIAGAAQPAAGRITVSGTVGLLDQTVRDGTMDLREALGIAEAQALLDRLEAGNGSIDDSAEADWGLTATLASALGAVGLPDLDLSRRLDSLSGGQQTRLRLARLLIEAPDMILLDEPTNNLDADGRAAIVDLLHHWRGGAIVVSHDRTLLNEMDAIVELTGIGARTYGGNWDHYVARKALDLAAAEHGLATAERTVAEVDRRAQAQVERKARKDSAGKAKRARGDMPKILLNGRRDQAQDTGGQSARLATRMRQSAETAAAEARAQIEILQPLSVKLTSTGLPAGRVVLGVSGLGGGPVDHTPIISNFDLQVIGPERIAISGANGSGKTTLLRLLTGDLQPVAGTVRWNGTRAFLDQTVSLLDPSLTIRDAYRALNPQEDENACRAALARFMFRADAALQTVGTLSGGELLRAGLAATIGGGSPPDVLILDEPTNHLDIGAIEAVEAGLRAYDGALIVVSHDRAFLEAIGIEREIGLIAG